MKRLVLLLGLSMIGGALFVLNDTAKMSARDADFKFDLATYASALPARAQSYAANDLGPALAALPQTTKNMYENWKNRDTREQVDQTDRLAGLKERNTAIARNGVTVEDVGNMSAYELYKNREAVMKGLTNSARKTMQGVFK